MRKSILIGVTAGVAAYKVLDLIKLLKNDGYEIFVIMTKGAAEMISPQNFERASGNKVYVNLFEKNFDYRKVLDKRKVEHIELADKTDVMVIAPATANIIGKLSSGIADDFLTTTTLAITSPIILCPSMNVNMWNNPLVQENLTRLKKLGFIIIEPTVGMLACGYEGKGRLENISVIKEEILSQLDKTDSLKGKKIIVTAGATREKIDKVRFITNRASGKMGVALAEELHLRGADVLLFRSVSSVEPRYLLRQESFSTAEELYYLIKKDSKYSNVIFHTAAVSDFKVAKPFPGKISSRKGLNLKLTPQLKILDQIKKLNPKIKSIAFKAEYGLPENKLIEAAYKRLKESRSDAIIANDISREDRGFEAVTNEVFIITPNKKVQKIPLVSKKEVARKIVDYLFFKEKYGKKA